MSYASAKLTENLMFFFRIFHFNTLFHLLDDFVFTF